MLYTFHPAFPMRKRHLADHLQSGKPKETIDRDFSETVDLLAKLLLVFQKDELTFISAKFALQEVRWSLMEMVNGEWFKPLLSSI